MKFYANPYDTEAKGFYFDTYEEYVEKSEALRNSYGQPVEEFMIDVIDGTSEECALVEAIGIDQCNLESVIEYIDSSNEHEWPAMFYLLDNNIVRKLEEAKDKVDAVCLYEGRMKDAASEQFDEFYGDSIPEEVKRHIDYDSYAYEMECDGDMTEFEFGGKTYTCTNANGL